MVACVQTSPISFVARGKGTKGKGKKKEVPFPRATKEIGDVSTQASPVEEAKLRKCYKRLICKQFVQVSGLCVPQVLRYLPKHFTHHCRALNIFVYEDAIFVYSFCTQIWPREINKNIWSSLFL